jgi:hypothetical protein
MLHPLWLISKIRDFKCSNCGRYPHSIVSIYGQAILPARGDRVIIRTDYDCRYCNRVVPAVTYISMEETAKLFADVIQKSGLRMTFCDPIQVAVLPPVLPSVVTGTPSDPIDAAEVDRASHVLKRTSFRRDSKSWKRFMNRLERGH